MSETKTWTSEERLRWLHDCSTGQTDPEGYEWGIYRVKWENGKAVSVMQTLSDFSDLDAEMTREIREAPQTTSHLINNSKVCKICDGGPGNSCTCSCGNELWEDEKESYKRDKDT